MFVVFEDIYKEGAAAYLRGVRDYTLNPYSGEAAEAWYEGWSNALNDDRCKSTGNE